MITSLSSASQQQAKGSQARHINKWLINNFYVMNLLLAARRLEAKS